MELFDNLKDRITTTGKDVSDKARETAAEAKVRSQINSEENKLKSLYADLGKTYYENPDDPAIEEYKKSVEATIAVIDDCQKQLDDMRGVKRCKVCGAVMSKDMLYCSQCGARNDPEPEETEPEAEGEDNVSSDEKHCPVCGAVVTDDMVFCPDCGTKLVD